MISLLRIFHEGKVDNPIYYEIHEKRNIVFYILQSQYVSYKHRLRIKQKNFDSYFTIQLKETSKKKWRPVIT